MKKLILHSAVLFLFFNAYSQSIPLNPESWNFKPNSVEFKTENGVEKMLISPSSGKVIAKNIEFSNGTIEFDSFATKALSFFFRMKDKDENEYFYLRTARAGDSTAMDAIQYAPYIDGVLMWNIYPQFQSNANFSLEGKNHFKFVVSGSRMEIYINSETPTLEVDHLEGNFETGLLGFEGDTEISNLSIDTATVTGLTPKSGIDPTTNNPRYIRKWAISEPIQVPGKIDFDYGFLPSPATKWEVISTERRGLVNIIRQFGNTEGNRLVWLKVRVDSETDQEKRVDFGFLTGVWVFLNGQITYLDKNLEGRLMAKNPDGRISVENTSFQLSLKKGSNELLIGIANQYWGSGAIARMENLEGITISPDPSFDHRIVQLSAERLQLFEGKYLTNDGIELTIASDTYSLIFKSQNYINATAYPKSDSLFFVRDFDAEFQFLFDSNKVVSGLEIIFNGEKFATLKKKKD
ncbi:hypothetical protein [Algoriphagus sp. Y33]|uniref:hypothetical protein n=1 Tax=Algoriphagus sp. Y33 TaxID=2772483 RepID=UPI00177F4C3D|nr:hypothetical protein [Algoriphagus sp. Y33]